MSGDKRRQLDLDDRILWNRVARSTIPLKGKRIVEPEIEPDFATLLDEADKAPPGSATRRRPDPAEGRKPVTGLRDLDTPTRQKLARGRLPVEAKLDLHGLTQGEAHGLLLDFLYRAQARGLKHVLVVTGKGSSPGSEGVLRRAVPAWLSTAPFRGVVGGHYAAGRRHGGDGAIYVRLKRNVSRP